MSTPADSSRLAGPLRVAIVGGGRVTETCHLPALKSLGDAFSIVALAEPNLHRRRRLAGLFDLPKTFESVESMLAESDSFDAVAVCTPAEHHAHAVIAAIEVGKHVLVEKPIALNLDDAGQISDIATSFPKQKLMVGFNLRHHRLVRNAKKLIDQGLLGDLQLIRTLWTSSLRLGGAVPAWRNRRQTGGGVLMELAVHHVDLLRYLTGSEISSVSATATHDAGDDETANLTLQLSNGAIANSSFSERAGNANELEIIGTKGKLVFSLYRFDSLKFLPTGGGPSRVSEITRTLKQLREAWPILRRGGDFRETYRAEWLAFAESIRTGTAPSASAEDGVAAVRAVVAAGMSTNRQAVVAINDAPRSIMPVELEGRSAVVSEQPASRDADGPALSAILATRSSFDVIRRTTRHLQVQTIQNKIELLIICRSKEELQLDEAAMDGFWGYQIIEAGDFKSVATPNAVGVRSAKSPIVVLCEDHAFPDPNWAEALIVAHQGPYAAVGPVVHNANPDSYVSRADFLIGYGEWSEPMKPSEPHHLPGHNSAYKRDALLAYGDKLDAMMEAETILQWDMISKGQSLYLDPEARLAHTNFAQLSVWTRAQFHAGRAFGGTRAIGWPIWKRIVFTCASPLIPLVRMKRILRHMSRQADIRQRVRPAMVLVVFYGLTLDGIGQMLGYATGVGGSTQINNEFERINFITEDDRQRMVQQDLTSADARNG